MPNNTIIQNPYTKLLPAATSINNDILRLSPGQLHSYYRMGYINGVLIDTKEAPEFVRKFAQYNFKYLRDHQKDGQSIIFEETKYYDKIKDTGKGKRVLLKVANCV